VGALIGAIVLHFGEKYRHKKGWNDGDETCQHQWGKAQPLNENNQKYICINCDSEK
jgi:phage gp45-like